MKKTWGEVQGIKLRFTTSTEYLLHNNQRKGKDYAGIRASSLILTDSTCPRSFVVRVPEVKGRTAGNKGLSIWTWLNGGKIGKIGNAIGEPLSAKEEKDSRATQPPLSGSTEIQAHRFAPLVSATTGPGSTGLERR
ncbi:hypothetical protein N7456_004438 [Penicillium angulare]|uniref:Uncharacterized protein n=1 Tax=Penicillium angulare TaxID=116970 RepID=A0A9W9FWQ2_9EURO|nr:hypothetical protein N7456_004438 [Penicillium angulare]